LLLFNARRTLAGCRKIREDVILKLGAFCRAEESAFVFNAADDKQIPRGARNDINGSFFSSMPETAIAKGQLYWLFALGYWLALIGYWLFPVSL